MEPCYGQAGRELARALLEGLLNVGEGGADAEEQKTFPYLVVGSSTLDLHTFSHFLSLNQLNHGGPAEPCIQVVQRSHDSVRVVLQGLHALCLTDVSLCMPAEDPCKYIRCLAPYLKVTPSSKAGQCPRKQASERREAECLLCILVRRFTDKLQWSMRIAAQLQ